MKSIRSEI